jgi:hypothetical protein
MRLEPAVLLQLLLLKTVLVEQHGARVLQLQHPLLLLQVLAAVLVEQHGKGVLCKLVSPTLQLLVLAAVLVQQHLPRALSLLLQLPLLLLLLLLASPLTLQLGALLICLQDQWSAAAAAVAAGLHIAGEIKPMSSSSMWGKSCLPTYLVGVGL